MAGPVPFTPIINGNDVTIQRLSDSGETGEETWGYNASINSGTYTISGNTVVWNDGTILQYNGVDVLPTDNIMDGAEYTTRAASTTGETWVLNSDLRTTARTSKNFTISFESNGTNYTALELLASRTSTVLNYNSTKVYEDAVVEGTAYWYAQEYRTIVLSEPASGDLLTWLQANGTKQSSKLSVDLTTLSGWSNLSSGSHTIKIVAKGSGYRDSEKSVGVSVTKPSSGYTVTITYGGLVSNVCFYSLDNGLTWIDGYVAGQSKLVLNNVKQIKFKAEDDGHSYAGIYSTLLNVSLHSGYNDGPKYSENFTLTQDVNDVEFNSGAD